jgi:hypothetical protein
MKHRPAEDSHQLLPAAAYTSDAYFQQELDLLFSRCWNFAGMSPAFRVGALAKKFEDMITVYQRHVLEFVSYS